MSEPIHGYQTTILRGVWETILTYGAPRLQAAAWAALNLALGLYLLIYRGIFWLALPIVLWLLGHLVLVKLTMWNPRWSDMFWAQVNNKYKDHYWAG